MSGKLFCKDKPNGALRTPIQCNAKAEYRIEYLKKAGETFIQDGACSKVAPKLSKCQECKSALQEPRLSPSKTLCRFDAFRRLRYTKNGNLATAGFLDPNKDVTQKDLSLWLPQHLSSSISPDMESSLFLLLHVSSQFYRLLEQEREAITINMAEKCDMLGEIRQHCLTHQLSLSLSIPLTPRYVQQFEIRAVIRFLIAKQISPIEIHRQLFEVYGENFISVQHVRKRCREFSEGCMEIHDENRSGQPVMTTVFWDSKGMLLIEFLPHGTTVNSDRYKDTLRKLRRAIQNRRGG
ncbi:Lysine-specific demethylase 3B [Homalodisca vitripennis]|nr:Lysine-specific demethylase 3B [Homalodisca vitripennis]